MKLIIKEHEDAPGEFLIDLQRHGLPESNCQTTPELRIVGEAIRLAALNIGERISMETMFDMRVQVVPVGVLPDDCVGIVAVPGPDGNIDLRKSVILRRGKL